MAGDVIIKFFLLCQATFWTCKHLFSCDEDIGQLGNVGAPAQVLNAVPETFFSALRNSARLI
jgi:hypothetical protein